MAIHSIHDTFFVLLSLLLISVYHFYFPVKRNEFQLWVEQMSKIQLFEHFDFDLNCWFFLNIGSLSEAQLTLQYLQVIDCHRKSAKRSPFFFVKSITKNVVRASVFNRNKMSALVLTGKNEAIIGTPLGAARDCSFVILGELNFDVLKILLLCSCVCICTYIVYLLCWLAP